MERTSYYRTSGTFPYVTLRTESLSDPQSNEVQIKIRAIGINFADAFSILGLYEAAPKGEFVPGLEFSGEIINIGSSVQRFKMGQRVMGVSRFGAYTTHLNVDQAYLLPLQDSWSFEEGAAYIVQTLTAYYGLVTLGRIALKETLLVQSAAGGVGLAALKIAKKHNCFVIGIVGDGSKIDFCKQQGYDEVFVRDTFLKGNLRRALGNRSLDVVMECIGGTVFEECLSLLSSQGRMIVYGFSRYMPKGKPSFLHLALQYLRRPKLDVENLNNRSVAVFNLINLFEKTDQMKRLLEETDGLGLTKPYIGHEYTFQKLPEAIQALRSGKTVGKVIVRV